MNTFGDILLTAVAGVTLLAAPTSPGIRGGAQPGGRLAGLAAADLPHQYAALAERSGSVANGFRSKLVIRDMATGRTMATRIASRPANSFCDLTGTPDGRTFVAEACKVTVTPLDGGLEVVTRPVRFCRLTVDGQGRVGRLRPLRIPVPSIVSMDGATVSPGGRKLAVASASGHDADLARNPAIRLYNLSTGRLLRTWRWAGRADIIGRNGNDVSIDPLSWTADGSTIAFPLMTGPEEEKTQVRLLDTAAPGSNLRRTRRVLNLGSGPGFVEGFGGEVDGPDSMITPDGSRIVASTVAVCCHGLDAKTLMTVSEFSVATGARVALLHSVPVPQLAVIFLPVLWSSPDGSTVIAAAAPPTGETMPVDIMSGRGITPLLGSMAGISQLAF